MFYIGDVPAVPLIVDLPDDGAHLWTAATGKLTRPDGTTTTCTVAMDGAQLIASVTIPGPLTVPGIHRVAVTLTDSTGGKSRVPALRFAVDDDTTGWYTVDEAREDADDFRDQLTDAVLYRLLTIARNDVLAYAPALPVTTPATLPPAHYVASQLAQAVNVWNANRVDASNGSEGDGTFTIRPFPLDWAIKQTLRPKNPLPVIG